MIQEDICFQRGFETGRVFAGAFYYMLKKAFDESRASLKSFEGQLKKDLEEQQLAGGQTGINFLFEMDCFKSQLYKLLYYFKNRATDKAKGMMTASKQRGYLSREAYLLLHRKILPELEIDLWTYFKDLAD